MRASTVSASSGSNIKRKMSFIAISGIRVINSSAYVNVKETQEVLETWVGFGSLNITHGPTSGFK